MTAQPLVCHCCGRSTTDWEKRSVTGDHGPVEVVYCRDAVPCIKARDSQPSRLPRRVPRP